jgi:RNA polymerase sigma factor (sigma-70 family)
VLRRARRILGDEGEAQEVLHDVFTSLVDRPNQFAGQSSPMTFLYRMTTNCALQRIRKRENRLRLLQTRYVAGDGSSAPDQESRARLNEALRSLPDAVAQIVVYYYVDGMTQQEVAEIMGCSRQWIDKQLQRLRRKGEGEEKSW